MKSAPALALYLVLTFVSAAVLAPVLYTLGHRWLDFSFARYVNRCLLLAALGWLIYFWRRFHLQSTRDIGLTPLRRFLPHFGSGFFIGVLTVALVLIVALSVKARVWTGRTDEAFLLLLFVPALLVSFVEEFLFRGVIQTVFRRDLGSWPGLILTALLFALLHFIKVPSDFRPAPLTWISGWQAVGLSFARLGEINADPTFYGLILVGLVLGLARLRTGTLWLAMGLHAGWIMGSRAAEAWSGAGVPGPLSMDFRANPVSLLLLAMTFVTLSCWKMRLPA